MIRWSIFFLFLNFIYAENPLWACNKELAPPELNLDLSKINKAWYLIHRGRANKPEGALNIGCEKRKFSLINDGSAVKIEDRFSRKNETQIWTIDKTNGNNYWINNENSLVEGIWLLSNRTLALSRCHISSDGDDDGTLIENEVYSIYRIVDSPKMELVMNELEGTKMPLHVNASYALNKHCYFLWELWDHPKILKHLEDFMQWAFGPLMYFGL